MKNWNIYSFNTVILSALFFLLTVNAFAVFYKDSSFVQFINALSVPVFVVFSLIKYKSDNISFLFFCLFVFLSDSSGLFLQEVNMFYGSSIFYVAACIHLLILVLPKLDIYHIDKSIKAYLLLMFLIATFFLSLVYNTMGHVFFNSVEAIFFVVKSLACIILGLVSFGVYLRYQNKKSIIFLAAIICFGFSLIFNNLNIYYLSEWRFSLLDRWLHIVGVFFVFKFIIEEKQVESLSRERVGNTGVSNNILA